MLTNIPWVSISILAAVLMVAAQQPVPPTPAPNPAQPNCTLSGIKPSGTTQSYHLATCIVAKFAAYIKIGENSYVDLKNGQVNTTISNCEGVGNQTVDPKLVINFDCGSLELGISKNNSEIFVKSLTGSFKLGNLPEINFSNSSKLFVTSGNSTYYKCNSEQNIVLQTGANANNNQTDELIISNFAYEAYRTANGTEFYKTAEECAKDKGPFSDGVRIGVGICLVAFVAIILVAYFVGRRRWSQRTSYESV